MSILGLSKSNRLPKGLTVLSSPTMVIYRLYNTDIVKFNFFTKEIILNVDSWFTRHSMKCINLALINTEYSLYQKSNTWNINKRGTNHNILYKNNISLPLIGSQINE